MSDTDVTEYDWDHRNRLTTITERSSGGGAATKVVSYEYDVFNRRLAKAIDSDGDGTVDSQQFFVYDGERADRDNAGDHIALHFEDPDGDGPQTAALSHRYLHGPDVDQILADEDVATGDVLWPLTDNLGTVRDLAMYDDVAATTAVVNHITYDAYGSVTSETDAAIEHLYGFTGRERDEESDLQFNRARYYDTALGQWLSEDPIGFEAGDKNIRRYVGNNATGSLDPSGLFDEELFWENVEKIDPDAKRWFLHHKHGGGGRLEQANMGFLWWFNSRGFWDGETPVVKLEKDFNEIEAAFAFVDRVNNDWDFKSYSNLIDRADGASPENMDAFLKWVVNETGKATGHGFEALKVGVSIVNEGADWAITTEEVSSGNWWAAVGYLPFVTGGAVKLLSKNDKVLATITPDQIRFLSDNGITPRSIDDVNDLAPLAKAAAGEGGCFVPGTLVHIPLDDSRGETEPIHAASGRVAWIGVGIVIAVTGAYAAARLHRTNELRRKRSSDYRRTLDAIFADERLLSDISATLVVIDLPLWPKGTP